MSRKDYQAIAGAIYQAGGKDRAFTGETAWDTSTVPNGRIRNGLVFELCRVLKTNNPRFDREGHEADSLKARR